jgi:hypothetical protein
MALHGIDAYSLRAEQRHLAAGHGGSVEPMAGDGLPSRAKLSQYACIHT